MTVTIKDVKALSDEVYEYLLTLKTYCDSRRNCAGCYIGKEACEAVANKLMGTPCDISSLTIGKADGKHPICFI